MDICVRHLSISLPSLTPDPPPTLLKMLIFMNYSTNCLTSGFLLGLTNVGALGRDKRKGRKYGLGIILTFSTWGSLEAEGPPPVKALGSWQVPLHTALSPSALEPTPPSCTRMVSPLASMSVLPYSHLNTFVHPPFIKLSPWMITIWRCSIFHVRTLTNRTTISIAQY